MLRKIFTSGLLCLALGACGGDEEEPLPDVDCGSMDVPKFTELEGLKKCVICHSSAVTNRQNAPAGVNYDTYDAAASEAEEAASEVFTGAMPPAGFPDLTEAEAEALYHWALCGVPE